MSFGTRILGALIVACSLGVQGAGLSKKFWFGGPEIFPIDHQVHSLNVADLDGDGRKDILVINIRRSRLNILYNRTGLKPLEVKKRDSRGVNHLPPDSRFELDSMSTELRVVGVTVGDFDGDQKPDIALYGEPRQLQFIRNAGKRQWDDPVVWELDEGVMGSNGIRKGDLNGDKRDDVLLLTGTAVLFFAQAKDGGLEEPKKIPFHGAVQAMDIVDLNADGRNDLLLINWDSRNPMRVRLQGKNGRLGPEVQHRMPRLRSFNPSNIDADDALELVNVLQQSGRVQIAEFSRQKDNRGFTSSPLWLNPLPNTSASSRGMTWADVNQDGFTDVAYAEPKSGAMRILERNEDGHFSEARTFPSLSGITQVQVSDWNNNKQQEFFVFSPEEKQIGVTEYKNGARLAFPELLPLAGKPVAFVVGRFGKDEHVAAAVLVDKDGKRALELHRAGKKADTITLSDEFRSSPSRMFFHDIDQDGFNDLVFLTPYEKIQVIRYAENSNHEEIDLFPPGGAVSKPIYGIADLNGDSKPELLLPQKNFVRAVVLEQKKGTKSWNFRVSDQINGSKRNSQVGAIAFRKAKKESKLYLLDEGNQSLSICGLGKDDVWKVEQDVELPVADFHSLESIQVGNDQNTLGFLGLNTVAWMTSGETGWEIDKSSSYETAVENGRLIDSISGDLNNDGRTDVIFLEGLRNHIEIAVYWANRLESVVRWRVFEQQTFRGARTRNPEPREAVIEDFTGDGRNDLAILVHDRVLLYPQEK